MQNLKYRMNFQQIRHNVYNFANAMLLNSGKPIKTETCTNLVSHIFPGGVVKVHDIKDAKAGINTEAMTKWASSESVYLRKPQLYVGNVNKQNFNDFCHELTHCFQIIYMNFVVFSRRKAFDAGLDVEELSVLFKNLSGNLREELISQRNSGNPLSQNKEKFHEMIKNSFEKSLSKSKIDINGLTKKQLEALYLYLNLSAKMEREAYFVDENVFKRFNGIGSYKISPFLFEEIPNKKIHLSSSGYEQVNKFFGLQLFNIAKPSGKSDFK